MKIKFGFYNNWNHFESSINLLKISWGKEEYYTEYSMEYWGEITILNFDFTIGFII